MWSPGQPRQGDGVVSVLKNKRGFLVGITILTVMSTSMVLPGPAGAGAASSPLAPTTVGAMHRWAAAHMADDWKNAGITQTKAAGIAGQFDLMVVARGEFDAFEPAMHAANPRLKTLVYLNGTYLPRGQAGKYPESDFAHTSTGARINQALKWGNYLMNVASPHWADAVAKLCSKLLASSHADGCYLDMMGPQALNPGYDTGLPVNPATGQVWSSGDYLGAVGVLAGRVRSVNPVPIAGNGLGDGPKYFDTKNSSRPALSYLDAAHAEIWLRAGGDPIGAWPSVADWHASVDMLGNAGAAGTPVLAQTKVWINATQAQIDQWHSFALASFLLGTDSTSWFTFSSSRTLAGSTSDHPWDRVDVGSPSSGYVLGPGGAYERPFTRGFAAVNPTTSTVTVALPGDYVDLNGNTVRTVTLSPHTGQVFTSL
jgi:hypothetical protein